MGKYTIIADTGKYLVELLQKELVPEVISNPDGIGLRSPEEHGDLSLGLFLYDVRESEEVRQQGTAMVRNEKIMKVPVYLNLYYMITAYFDGDIKYRLMQEEKILGKVIQTFHDHPVLPLAEVDPEGVSGVNLQVQMLRMSVEEKSKIWSFPNMGNRLSLYYKVSPVAIDSGVSKKITRVTDLDINVSHVWEKK